MSKGSSILLNVSFAFDTNKHIRGTGCLTIGSTQSLQRGWGERQTIGFSDPIDKW